MVKNIYKNNLLTLLILVIFVTNLQSQDLKPYIKNFSPKEYGNNLNVQNWSVCQNAKGEIFVGNYSFVLSFDGYNWQKNQVSNNSGYIVSLLSDSDRVYVGGNNTFGYLDKQRKYVSLSDSIKNEFGNVWRIFKQNNKVVFFTQNALYIYDYNNIAELTPLPGKEKSSFHLAFQTNGQIFVRQRGTGLLELVNGKLKQVSDFELFKEYGIFGIHNVSRSKYLIISREQGLFSMIKTETGYLITRKYTNNDDALKKLKIIGSTKLNDNTIALNTENEGIVFIDFEGNILYKISEKHGLSNNDVKQVFQDNYNNLWAATANGISLINIDSPISFYDEKSGLNGNAYHSLRFANKTFVATSAGLYVSDNTSENELFKKIKQINNSAYSLEKSEKYLFVGTSEKLWFCDSLLDFKTVADVNSLSIRFIPKRKMLITAGINGVFFYKLSKNGLPELLKSFPELAANSTNIEYEFVNDKLTVWITTLKSGVFKIEETSRDFFDYDFFYGENDGLDENWIRVFKFNNNLIFSNSSGILKFLTAEEIKKDLPDSLKNDVNRGYFIPDTSFRNSKISISSLCKLNDEIYAVTDTKLKHYNDETKDFETSYFANISSDLLNSVSGYDNFLLISGNSGLIKFDLTKVNYTKLKPDFFVHYIFNGNDTIDFSKNINKELSFDFKKNNLIITLSDVYCKDGKKLSYSYKLQNLDSKWTEWTTSNKIILNRLYEGDYNILIKAKTPFNVVSGVKQLSFTILPPWYRSIWAYILYFILLVLIVWLIVVWNTKRLKQRNAELEKIVAQRTKEIKQQKEEIEEIHKELKDSIIYAEKIQKAVLPAEKTIQKNVSDSFILFKPKDIVSGDFYWAAQVGDKLIVTAADCTGHGVPGGFMSMLGVSFLNEIVVNDHILNPAEILNILRKKVVNAMQQKGEEGEQKDGMDISLCVLNTSNLELEWAGANNPLYIIKDEELKSKDDSSIKLFDNSKLKIQNPRLLYEVKPDKMPIAIYERMNSFTSHKFQLSKGDIIYMFSDGFADQFGGLKGKKFKYKPFKRLLLENSDKPMSEQKEILDKTITAWMNPADSKSYEQIDDICIVGIKV